MRLDHRQRTGCFRHLPVIFLAIGVLGLALGASAATSNLLPVSPPAASDGSEDPDVLLQMYMEWLLRDMRATVPAQQNSASLANAVIRAYEEKGTPNLKPVAELEFVNTILRTQAHLAAYPELLDADTTNRLNFALAGMLDDLVGKVRVAP